MHPYMGLWMVSWWRKTQVRSMLRFTELVIWVDGWGHHAAFKLKDREKLQQCQYISGQSCTCKSHSRKARNGKSVDCRHVIHYICLQWPQDLLGIDCPATSKGFKHSNIKVDIIRQMHQIPHQGSLLITSWQGRGHSEKFLQKQEPWTWTTVRIINATCLVLATNWTTMQSVCHSGLRSQLEQGIFIGLGWQFFACKWLMHMHEDTRGYISWIGPSIATRNQSRKHFNIVPDLSVESAGVAVGAEGCAPSYI
jgi:hypothetical protein